jgi:hypothetical protein
LSTNTNSRINIVADTYNSVESAMIQKILSSYSFPIEGLVTNTQQWYKLIEELSNTHSVTTYDFSTTATNKYYMVEENNNDFLIIIRSGVKEILIIDIYSKNIPIAESLFNLVKKYEDSYSDLNVKIVSFSIGMGGNLDKMVFNKNQDDFKKLSKLYYPFLDIDEMFKQYLISNDSLLLLAGGPGTGKTKIVDMLLKFAIDNHNLLDFDENDDEESINVAYVKNPQILATDTFWNTLTKSAFNFVILDDMDHILTDRNISNESQSDSIRLSFISNFLSYTDGIFENNTKFIITTNQSVNNIDSAILRKGRCFDVLSFRQLKHSEAKNIWVGEGLPLDKFDVIFGGQDNINAADVGAKIEMENNLSDKHMKVKSSYINEEGISLYRKNLYKKVTV